MNTACNAEAEVTISGFRYRYRRWHPGERLRGHLMAIDTETALIDGHQVPSLALATASGDRWHVLIHPDDLGHFILTHSHMKFVGHNVAFDYWVIHDHLLARSESEALEAWKTTVAERRLHDTMLLDMLLRLAEGTDNTNQGDDQAIYPRDLAEVVRCYTGMEISKEDPYRLRFGEIIDQDWELVDPGFFEYAIKDTMTTREAYFELSARALDCMAAHGFPAQSAHFSIYPDAVSRFGPLSEAIQVEAAIALAQISRNGMHTHSDRLRTAIHGHQTELDGVIAEFCTRYPGVLKLDRNGVLMRTPSGLPSKSNKALDQYLVQAAQEIGQRDQVQVAVPMTEKNNVSHSLDLWEALVEKHPFLQHWSRFEELSKKRQFFEMLNQPVIRPRYNVLVRTGRTSCSSPNMQQVPRDGQFRQIIVPSPGYLLLTVDYSFVELVTLAATCQARFGFSRLGDVIRQGIDPHCYTAAMLTGVSLNEFMSWKSSDKDRFKLARQQAKPVNFGVPGGMGLVTLVERAESDYGVTMTPEQAESFRTRLTTEIYPELGQYLADNSMAHLSQRLNVPEIVCRDTFCFGDMSPSTAATIVRKIVSGNPRKSDGSPYNPDYVRRVWDDLNSLNRNPELSADLRARAGGSRLVARLFDTSAVTLTGRIRGNTGYTQQRNTPFQSLASDGAKRALWRLVLAGFRVVGFIHDEILVELPDQGGYVDQYLIDAVVKIMKDSMQEMVGDVPVGCEYALSVCWSKSAELILDEGKVRAWRPADSLGQVRVTA